MKSCAAFGCNNRFNKENGKLFHRFPFGKPDILQKWIGACCRKSWTPTRWAVLCSDHFKSDNYKKIPGSNRNCLKDDAVPSKFNFPLKKCSRSSSPVPKAVTSPISAVKSEPDEVENVILVRDVGTQCFVHTLDKSVQSQYFSCKKHVGTQSWDAPTLKEMEMRKKIKVLQQQLRRKVMQLDALKKFIEPLKNRKDPNVKKVFSIQNEVSRSVTSQIPLYTLQVDLFEQ